MVETAGNGAELKAAKLISLNLLLLGEKSSGKSLIFDQRKFDKNRKINTSGVDFQLIRYVSPDGDNIRVKVWEIMGHERYQVLT